MKGGKSNKQILQDALNINIEKIKTTAGDNFIKVLSSLNDYSSYSKFERPIPQYLLNY
jgi:hypothetical protein